MTANFYPQEENFDSDEWYASYDLGLQADGVSPQLPFDVVTLVAAILVIIALLAGMRHLFDDVTENAPVQQPRVNQPPIQDTENLQPLPPITSDPTAIIAPYSQYIVTQGVHGQSYGHLAVDIAAGKGETIKSPIEGVVTDYFFDAIGNPTLIIENDYYEVTMLHGNYTVSVGDQLRIGDPVGTEGNLGNTRDMQGRSCRNRDCGYHTHLNVFDKKAGINIDPLELIGG